MIALLLAATCVCARPVSEGEAAVAVSAWLAGDARPMNAQMGHGITGVQRFSSEDGSAAYYVVNLVPSGFVIVAPDDLIEPIVAFSDHGDYDPSPQNPLANLISKDMRARKAVARSFHASSAQANGKWQRLRGVSAMNIGIMGLSSVSDVRVAPLAVTKWSQSYLGCSPSVACYNYYTPPNAEGTYTNYPCGCVATAMAQLMKFHGYPTAGIGVKSFTIKVDGVSQSASTRGGDGAGNPYVWASMPNTYGCSSTLAQRQAVGDLCYDASISINTEFASAGSGILASQFGKVADRLIGTFLYSNAKKGYRSGLNIGTNLNKMVNPNLDAGWPVLLGINSSTSGHFIVCDGYGYNSSTLYHHLNMGWAGTSDAWYNLPNIDAYYPYDTIHSCTYNVYTSGSGEIISGRVMDSQGHPIPGAAVTATWASNTYGPVTTNSYGVYGIGKVPSNKSFTVSVTHALYTFTPRSAATGTSSDMTTTCGNVMGIDFTGVGGPAISSFLINSGAFDTAGSTVTLNNTCTGSPSQYMASESASFTGATWKTYSTAPSFTLSAGEGPKTVYFKVKNSVGTESSVANDSIILDAANPVTSAAPVGGVYTASKSVALTCSETASIYYTTNGTEPTAASPIYSSPISVTSDKTLRFFAVDTASNSESPKKQERYWILSGDGSIASIETLSNGAAVRLGNKGLYLKSSGFGYVEELSRVSGIRVNGTIPANEGDTVCLVGTMTTVAGERAVILDAMTASGSAAVPPLAVSNTGLAKAIMCGLHVTTWGKVQSGSITGNSYIISDGSTGIGIRVITAGAPGVSAGQFVIVTGAAGFDGLRIIYAQ